MTYAATAYLSASQDMGGDDVAAGEAIEPLPSIAAEGFEARPEGALARVAWGKASSRDTAPSLLGSVL